MAFEDLKEFGTELEVKAKGKYRQEGETTNFFSIILFLPVFLPQSWLFVWFVTFDVMYRITDDLQAGIYLYILKASYTSS